MLTVSAALVVMEIISSGLNSMGEEKLMP